MQITKDKLDTPFIEFVEGATNTETPREFIRNSEKEFEMEPANLEEMTADELNSHIDFLDYLWGK